MTIFPMPDVPDGQRRVFREDHCANCLAPLTTDTRGLFCSVLCQELAKAIRYIRKVSRSGALHDPDVRYAVDIKLAHLHSGGYDSAAHKIPDWIRAQVKERAAGRCVRCASPGEEIDHIDGASSDPSNLQLLCMDCHRAKTDERRRPASEMERVAVEDLIERRVQSAVPVLLADDEEQWAQEERSLRAARWHRIKLELAGLVVRTQGRVWADVVDELHDAESPAATPMTEDDDSTYEGGSYFERAMQRYN